MTTKIRGSTQAHALTPALDGARGHIILKTFAISISTTTTSAAATGAAASAS
jgi:hypothetical protein